MRSRGLMRLLLAERTESGRRKLVAGSVYLTFGRTVSYAFNGRDPQELGTRPNDAIQWQAIHDACKEGFRHFDFGEVVEAQAGLAQFKEKWGATPRQLYRYYFPPHGAESRDHSTADRLVSVLTVAWRKLPLQMTGILGDWINSCL
jgi:lipid II:glycine glycyltransferase (peptidoglycan interpeptide bridge formation enzyme)